MSKIGTVYNFILEDPEWLAWARIVDGYTTNNHVKFGCNHGRSHWQNVAEIAMDFAKQAGAHYTETALAGIAGLLHDCGMICGEENHAYNGSCIARPYLQAFWGKSQYLTDKQIDIICHAIAEHSDCREINNIVDAAIMFADKIDLSYKRVMYASNDILRQVSRIQHVGFNVDSHMVTVSYSTDEDFDFLYFFNAWPKAYEVPAKVAAWLEKDFALFVNNQRIILP